MRGVVVLGDIVVDVVATMSAAVAPGSDSPARIRVGGGGAGGNVAAWLADLGVPVTLVGRVGDDDAGHRCSAELVAAGVRLAVTVDPDHQTGTVVALVDAAGERSMITDRGANGFLRPQDVSERVFRAGRHLHLSGYVLLDEGSRAAAVQALRLARAARMTVSVDPASTAPLRLAGVDRFLTATEGAQLLLPNAAEAALLAGRVDTEQAARILTGRYDAVVASRGPDGAAWAGGGRSGRVPAEPADVVDTTGAGDAFTAGVLSAWLAGQPLPRCAAAGTRTAARAVTGLGARPDRNAH